MAAPLAPRVLLLCCQLQLPVFHSNFYTGPVHVYITVLYEVKDSAVTLCIYMLYAGCLKRMRVVCIVEDTWVSSGLGWLERRHRPCVVGRAQVRAPAYPILCTSIFYLVLYQSALFLHTGQQFVQTGRLCKEGAARSIKFFRK